MSDRWIWWVVFNAVVLVMLALDLGLVNRKAHEIKIREALIWSAVWILSALAFNLGIYLFMGHEQALDFFTGYLLEKSLSVDNLFVFIMIFSFFRVPSAFQHRVLFWGILGALIMRAIFIATGVVLINRFDWVVYLFGAFLIVTGIRMAVDKEKKIEPEHNPVLRLLRRFARITPGFEGGKLMLKKQGKLFFTPLFVVLIVIETTDVIFAMDSIPAVLAITRDPFIVYSSNVFAILGLRALYFALAGVMSMFHHLRFGLSAILAFVGAKMILSEHHHLPTWVALSVIAGVLALSIVASLIWPQKKKEPPASEK